MGMISEAYEKQIEELQQEVVRLKAMLFHFTGKME